MLQLRRRVPDHPKRATRYAIGFSEELGISNRGEKDHES